MSETSSKCEGDTPEEKILSQQTSLNLVPYMGQRIVSSTAVFCTRQKEKPFLQARKKDSERNSLYLVATEPERMVKDCEEELHEHVPDAAKRVEPI